MELIDVCNFLKEAGVYYLATVDENNHPHVRPFGTAHIYEGKLCIQTGRKKDVARQIELNPNVEISAFKNGSWIRIEGRLQEKDSRDARVSMLGAYPELKAMYDPDDGNTLVLSFASMKATVFSFTAPPVSFTL